MTNTFHVEYPFTSAIDAMNAAKAQFAKCVWNITHTAYGVRRDGESRYQIKVISKEQQAANKPSKASRQACDSRKTSAKAICVKLFAKHSADRAAFTVAAQARGIKLLTVNTLWNDIKAGRVA